MTRCIEDIREFWESRARQYGDSGRATLNESSLRQLEIGTMMRRISRYRPRRVLDVGCGNGFSTKQFSRRFPDVQFTGLDYSPEMIRHAKRESPSNCTFLVADVLKPQTLPQARYDLILTQRCIQNIPEDRLQIQAIEHLMALRTDGGRLLMMECSKNGVKRLNRMRRRFGREALENVQPWHNRFFLDGRMGRRFNARIEHFSSTYMFLTKVLHPRLARLARLLPPIGRFGYDKLYVIE